MTDIKPGDRVIYMGLGPHRYTVVDVDTHGAACRRDDNRMLYLFDLTDLTLVPPKIAEPPRGEVVWDFYEPAGKRIAWRRSRASMWAAYVNEGWAYRYWSDFSDDATLAVDPKAGA